jgi:hypothetical protein
MTYVAAVAVLCAFVLLLSLLASKVGWRVPTVQDLQSAATMANTKGGVLLILLAMWIVTLGATLAFGIWIIHGHLDPQNAIVVTLMAMLVSQAFGNVNGAFFTAIKGEDPKPPIVATQTDTTIKTTATTPLESASPLAKEGI